MSDDLELTEEVLPFRGMAGWTKTPMFADIARTNLQHFVDAMEKSKSFEENAERASDEGIRQHIQHDQFKAESEAFGYGCVAIICAAAAIEAFINDYGARRLGGGFFEKHLDRMEVTSKIVVIFRLVTTRAFPTDGQAFENIKKLFTIRNSLVHGKSKMLDFEKMEESIDAENARNTNILEFVPLAVGTLRQLSDVARGLDETDGGFALLLSSVLE